MKIISIIGMLATTACLARAFPGGPGACVTGGPSPARGLLHNGNGMGQLTDGDIIFTIDGKEADTDGQFSLLVDTDYEVILKVVDGGATPSFRGFLAVVGKTSTLLDSSDVFTFDEVAFPLATTRANICPATNGFISHSNPTRAAITEIKSTLRFDKEDGPVGDLISLDVNVVVVFNLWYYTGFTVKVSDKPVAPTFCFSGESTVDVRNKGTITMMDLKIGDLVRVAENKYEPVYSFGHYDQQGSGEFLLINNKLEVSPDHLVASKDSGYIPASTLKVGDYMVSGDNGATTEVTSIVEKISKGVYAPFTTSGTIVVDGILASSFVSLQGDTGSLTIGGVATGLSHHWLAHKFELPHRIACHYFGSCPNVTYTENGISHWVNSPRKFFVWLLDQNAVFIALMLIPFTSFLALFTLVEALLTTTVAVVAVGVLFTAMYRNVSNKKVKTIG